jgi:hypothetical protein
VKLRGSDAFKEREGQHEALDGEGMGTGKPDASRCDPEADPAHGRPVGSGINPDFKDDVECDAELLLCVLKRAPPQLD